MLYQIIPPVLIIISLAGIVWFFMKKASEIANLSDSEILEQERILGERLAEAGFLDKIIIRIKNIKWHDIAHWMLVFLEKITKRARIIFLKLESTSKDLGDSIRHKRSNGITSRKNILLNNVPEEESIIQKVKDYKPEKKKYFAELKSSILKKEPEKEKPAAAEIIQNASLGEAGEERIIKPIISDKVAIPKNKTEIKDRLEELLIERIAVNPKDSEAYERLGEYYLEIRNFHDSKECFKQVLKLDPLNKNARYRMRRLENLMRN